MNHLVFLNEAVDQLLERRFQLRRRQQIHRRQRRPRTALAVPFLLLIWINLLINDSITLELALSCSVDRVNCDGLTVNGAHLAVT